MRYSKKAIDNEHLCCIRHYIEIENNKEIYFDKYDYLYNDKYNYFKNPLIYAKLNKKNENIIKYLLEYFKKDKRYVKYVDDINDIDDFGDFYVDGHRVIITNPMLFEKLILLQKKKIEINLK